MPTNNSIIDRLFGKRWTDGEKKDLTTFMGQVGQDMKNQSSARKLAIDKIIEDQLDRVTQNIEEWRTAIAYSEDPNDPDPFWLYQMYVDILDDDQVHATKQQRIAKATGGRIALKDKDNNIDEEATLTLIKPDGTPQPWFRSFLQICMMSKWYGYAITQFRPPIDGQFVMNPKNGDKPTEEIPFENMVPRLRSIRKDINVDVQSKDNLIPVYGGPGANWLIACGREKDLGLLNKIAPFWIWKKVFGSWSQHANIFGMPFRSGKTDIQDTDRMQNMINMFEVDITYPTGGSGNASDIYKNLIDKCDQAIAKITLSQTGTTDEKSFVGSAEVHEGVLFDLIWSDKLDLAAVIDEQLIPFLKRIGMLPEGSELFASWEVEDKTTVTEWATIVKELALIYDLDPEEIGKKFNLKLETKETVAIPGQPQEPEAVKKIKEIQNLYKQSFQ